MIKNIGQHENALDELNKNLGNAKSLYHCLSAPFIQFELSTYGGLSDFLNDNPTAMKMFNPKDPNNITLTELLEKEEILNKISKKFRFEIKATRFKKFHQAKTRAFEIISFLFHGEEAIYIAMESSKHMLQEKLFKLVNYLNGQKIHSEILSIKYPYHDDKDEENDNVIRSLFPYKAFDPRWERWGRILFRHRFFDIRLKSLIKNLIYKNTLRSGLYLLSMHKHPIVVHVYDDSIMEVTAPPHIIKALHDKFKDWANSV